MTIHSLFTHHYADGGVGEMFESTKHLKLHGIAAKSDIIQINGDYMFKCKKTTEKNIKCLWCHPSVLEALTFILDLKQCR